MQRVILCFLVLALPLCAYPVFLRVPTEIQFVFGRVESDLFSWYRMWLVFICACFFIFSKDWFSKSTAAFFALVTASTFCSPFFRTSLFGSPWVHEGLLAIVSYGCIYLAAKNHGLFKNLERCIDASIVMVFIMGIYQIVFTNIPILWFFPDLSYTVEVGSMFSTLGGSNNLGLFCALMFPYAAIRKKYVLTAMVLLMAACSLTRGAWLSIAITSFFLDRKLKIVLLLLLSLGIPFHKRWMPRVKQTVQELSFPIQDSAFSGRAYMWKRAIPQLQTSLILGHGPGTFGIYFPQKEQRARDIGFYGLIVDRPHNIFINLWANNGLPAFLLLMGMFAAVLIKAKDKSLQLSCIGFLIAGVFTDSVLSVTPYFIIFLGALAHQRGKYEYNEKRGHG